MSRPGTHPGRAALARLAPETVGALAEVDRVVAASVDAATLALVRHRVHALLGLPLPADAGRDVPAATWDALDDWATSPAVDDAQRALLGFVEQFVFSVSSMGDAEVEALLEHLEPLALHVLCNAVWAIDLGARVDHVAAAVLA